MNNYLNLTRTEALRKKTLLIFIIDLPFSLQLLQLQKLPKNLPRNRPSSIVFKKNEQVYMSL